MAGPQVLLSWQPCLTPCRRTSCFSPTPTPALTLLAQGWVCATRIVSFVSWVCVTTLKKSDWTASHPPSLHQDRSKDLQKIPVESSVNAKGGMECRLLSAQINFFPAPRCSLSCNSLCTQQAHCPRKRILTGLQEYKRSDCEWKNSQKTHIHSLLTPPLTGGACSCLEVPTSAVLM